MFYRLEVKELRLSCTVLHDVHVINYCVYFLVMFIQVSAELCKAIARDWES